MRVKGSLGRKAVLEKEGWTKEPRGENRKWKKGSRKQGRRGYIFKGLWRE